MTRDRTPVVVGVGASTPLGMSAAASAAAVRAGISGFGLHPFMVDDAGQRMVVAAAPYLSHDAAIDERAQTLAALALAEALEHAGGSIGRPVPVFTGLPLERGGVRLDQPELRHSIERQMHACGLRPADIQLIEAGHAAGSMALHAAWLAVRGGSAEFALAGGVDSYLEPQVLEWLEACDQLHSAGEENNPYGFVPGEAAAFVLLAAPAAIERDATLAASLRVLAAATTREHKLIKTDEPCTGQGLSELVRTLATALPPGSCVDEIYIDLNGEPYRSDEFGFTSVRTKAHLRDASDFIAPADCWGDVGAASGPLFVALADASVRRGYARGRTVVALTSSESGQRSGVVCETGSAEGGA